MNVVQYLLSFGLHQLLVSSATSYYIHQLAANFLWLPFGAVPVACTVCIRAFCAASCRQKRVNQNEVKDATKLHMAAESSVVKGDLFHITHSHLIILALMSTNHLTHGGKTLIFAL